MELLPQRATDDVPPPREPSAAFIAAAAKSRKESAKVLLEVRQTSTGKVWGSVKPREFSGMIRDGDMARAIREAYGPFSEKQKDLELREFLPDAVFRKAVSIAQVIHSHVR